MNNVFITNKLKSELTETFYKLLITGKEVSYEDILMENNPEIDISKTSISNLKEYGVLKKTVPQIVNILREFGYEIKEIKSGRNTYYQAMTTQMVPLDNMYYRLELEEHRRVIRDCIYNKEALKIKYCPFDKPELNIVFHPHIITEYNDRLFVIGVSELDGFKEPMRQFVVAIDRIEGEIKFAKTKFIPPLKDEYSYLWHLIGVTRMKNSSVSEVIIRAYGKYMFGLLKTKPLHYSQEILCEPTNDKNYGEVSIKVYPNNELIGKILSYGSDLEIISPDYLRSKIKEVIETASQRYNS